LRLTGSLTARIFHNIAVPKLRMPEPNHPLTLMKLLPSGAKVRQGDLLAEFDSLNARDHLDDTKDNHHNRINQVARLRAYMDVEIGALALRVRRARADADKARLDMKSAPVRSAIQRERYRLAAEEAEAAFTALEEQLALKVESQSSWLRIVQIGEEMERAHVVRHEDDLARMTVHSPGDGVVVVRTFTRHDGETNTFSAGDRVAPGSLLMQVVDRGSMQVEGTFNQADSRRFRVGQEAVVSLESVPGARYRGKVSSVGALAVVTGRNQPYLRSVPVRVEILDPDDRLLPHLTASADVLIEKEENVLLAPAEALREENGETYVLVQTAAGPERRPVSMKRLHGTQVALAGGVAEGEVLVLE
jgi:hypothetical protein